jgi:hypothetical protein
MANGLEPHHSTLTEGRRSKISNKKQKIKKVETDVTSVGQFNVPIIHGLCAHMKKQLVVSLFV